VLLVLPDGSSPVILGLAAYHRLVETRPRQHYPCAERRRCIEGADPEHAPDLTLAIGPAGPGVDDFDISEDLAAPFAQRVGAILDQPAAWPRGTRAVKLRAARPDLRTMPEQPATTTGSCSPPP
jgi:hypothetical protein